MESTPSKKRPNTDSSTIGASLEADAENVVKRRRVDQDDQAVELELLDREALIELVKTLRAELRAAAPDATDVQEAPAATATSSTTSVNEIEQQQPPELSRKLQKKLQRRQNNHDKVTEFDMMRYPHRHVAFLVRET